MLKVLRGIVWFLFDFLVGPNIRAILMNVNPSERRGTVFSAFTLCDDLGKGLGPSLATKLNKCKSRGGREGMRRVYWFSRIHKRTFATLPHCRLSSIVQWCHDARMPWCHDRMAEVVALVSIFGRRKAFTMAFAAWWISPSAEGGSATGRMSRHD